MIELMEAGRDLDARVAEKVKGYRWETVGKDARGEHGGGKVLVPPGVEADWYRNLPNLGAVHPGYFARQWSTRLDEAWYLFQEMIGFFSRRQRFYEALQQIAQQLSGASVVWPEVLTVLHKEFPRWVSLAAIHAYTTPAGDGPAPMKDGDTE